MLKKWIKKEKANLINAADHEAAFKYFQKINDRIRRGNNWTCQVVNDACRKSSFLYIANRAVFYHECGYTNFL